MRISITSKLIIFVLLLSLISTFVVGKYSFEKAKQALVQRTFDQLTSLRIEKANRISNFFQQCENDISNISLADNSMEIIQLINQPGKISNDRNLHTEVKLLYNNYLKAYIEARKYYSKIIFLNQKDAYTIYANDSINKQECYLNSPPNPLMLSIFDEALNNNKVVIEDLNKISEQEEPALYIAKQVFTPDKLKGGVVILEIPIKMINNIMVENSIHNGLGETGETYLVGNDYLMRSNSRFQNNSVFKTRVNTVSVREAFNGITGTKEIVDYRNIAVLSSFSTVNIPGLNWAILAEIDTKEAMIPIYSIRTNIIYLTIIIFLLLLGVVGILTSMITAPIRSLISKTDKVSKGEFGQTLNYKANDEVGDLVNAFNRMTLQLKAQSEKLEAERRLRLTSLIDGQEIERQRLSKELHDGLGPLILASKLKFERALNEKPGQAGKIFKDTEELFRKTMQELRDISEGLMPAVLTEFGLQTAVRNLAKEMADSSGIQIICESNIKTTNINSKFETSIYRIIQEAVNNAIKHANASKIIIKMNDDKENFNLSVIDNGIGFSSEKNEEKKGNGLNNMKDRAIVLGGEFEIKGQSGKGTEVNLLIKNFFHGGN